MVGCRHTHTHTHTHTPKNQYYLDMEEEEPPELLSRREELLRRCLSLQEGVKVGHTVHIDATLCVCVCVCVCVRKDQSRDP